MAQSNDKVSSSTEEFEGNNIKKLKDWFPWGFGTIYKAIWKDKNKAVVLKSLNNMNENSNDFLNEWKYHQSLDSYRFIKLYGFTKDPVTSDYMVVMDYANKACYTSRLLNFTSKKLNDILKSECLDCIVNDMNSFVD
ncbi:kinase-like domain-containing protein [Rhizophagus irregularis DAOM 181602=DAOM 197198]|nr:kinase-like domain-containing protein [Rhizophagus irregularis DAOM 181602=DAOM 197198]